MVCGDRAERDGGKLCLRAVGPGHQHDGHLSADDNAGIFAPPKMLMALPMALPTS